MASEKITCCNIPKIIGINLIAVLLSSTIISSQPTTEQRIELPEFAIVNLLKGISSDNLGVKKSCIYFAGNYRIMEVSKDLVEQIEMSNDLEVCQMIIWSLYQIGNDSCCEKLQAIMKEHPSEELKAFCNNLHKIKEYQTAIAAN